MNQNKKRTIILPLAMMFSLTGCDPKSYKPNTMNLEEEMKKCEQQNNCEEPAQVVTNPDGSVRHYHSSGMNHFLMYYFLFSGRTGSNGFSSNYMNKHSGRISDFSPSQQGRFSSGGYSAHAASLAGARTSSLRSGGIHAPGKSTISRSGFGSTGKSFSVRA